MSEALPLARRDRIAGRLAQGRSVVAADLAAEFAVSEDAIRRDLRALAAEGRCRRVYGGALPLTPATAPMALRMEAGRERKAALARAGAARVEPGEFLFLDCSSSNLELVPCLPEDAGLTVATNSVDIAAALLRRPDLRLIMVGGAVDPVVGGCVDAAATIAVARMHIDRCFLGACSVEPEAGISANDYADALFKRTLLGASRQSVVLAATDKLGACAPHAVATLREIGCLVVEADAPPPLLEHLARAGASVLQAAPPA
jgi:DeoR/GlpR family transcriptional regulator of sugar metabolism